MKNVNHHLISVLLLLVILINTTLVNTIFAQSNNLQYNPPKYADTSAFFEKNITITHDEINLPAIITIPKGKGPFPAIILVHGSGPNDKDETIGRNKPFKDLAWGLASKGIAVLRYDKRTFVFPGKNNNTNSCFTIDEEVIEDALAAFNTLKDFKEENIKISDVYFLGHSLGGCLSPKIMNSINNKASGIIMMASPYRFMDEVLYDQVNSMIKQAEKDSTDIKPLEELYTKVLNLKNMRLNKQVFPAADLPFNLCSNYWEGLNNTEPVDELKNVNKPILFMQGGKDFEVSPNEFQMYKTYLSSRKSATFKLYPELNHLMIKGSGSASPKEYETEGHVENEVINDIAGWINKN